MRESITLVSTIQNLRRQLNDIKSGPQFIGRDNLLTYRTQSSASYDMSATLAPGGVQNFRLTLDYAKAQGGTWVILNIFYRINNSAVMASPVPRLNPTNPDIEVYWQAEAFGDTSASWIVTIANITGGASTFTGYAKYFIDGTDTGVVTITAI